MNVAFVVHGHFRSFESCSDSWLPFFDQYNPDIFIHSWSTRGSWRPSTSRDINDPGCVQLDDDSITIDNFSPWKKWIRDFNIDHYETHKAKFIQDVTPIVEYQQTCPHEHHGINVHARYSQAYGVYEADRLRLQSHVDYDYVILARPDYRLETHESFEHIEDEFAEGLFGYRGVKDFCVKIAKPHIMTINTSMYDHYLPMVMESARHNDPHACFDTHAVRYHWLVELHNIPIVNTPIHAHAIR